MFGTRDLFVPAWMHRSWEAALPQAEVERIPGFPHQPHLRDPRLVAEMILDRSTP